MRRWRAAAALGVLLAAGLMRAPAVRGEASGGRPESREPAPPVRVAIVGASEQAPTGRWDPRTGVWEFTPPRGGRVEVEWGPWRGSADQARWEPGREVATLAGEVHLERADLEAFASRAEALVRERRARLEGGVRVVQHQLGEDGRERGGVLRTLTAERVEVDDRAQLLHALGAVHVQQASPAFEAEGDDLTYDLASGRMVLSAGRGVRGSTQGYRLTQASRLQYDVRTGELGLFGPAVVQQQPQQPAGPTGGEKAAP